jgi:hypothetical protein
MYAFLRRVFDTIKRLGVYFFQKFSALWEKWAVGVDFFADLEYN